MNMLITGSTGFIGSHFCKNYAKLSLSKLDSNIRLSPSCSSNSLLQAELNNISVVLHLAGLAHGCYSEQELDDVNHLGSLELASAAARAGVKRFVFVSTVNVNGSFTGGVPFVEESGIGVPLNPSKEKAEQGLKKIGDKTGMEITIVRPVLVYGKNSRGNMGSLIKIATKLSFTPFGLVKNKRSFMSVGNLCDFLYTCCTHPKAANEVFLISDDQIISTPELMSAIAKGLSKSMWHWPVPVWLMRYLGKFSGRSKQVEQLVGNLLVDCSKAKKLLGWVPPETMAQAMARLK